MEKDTEWHSSSTTASLSTTLEHDKRNTQNTFCSEKPASDSASQQSAEYHVDRNSAAGEDSEGDVEALSRGQVEPGSLERAETTKTTMSVKFPEGGLVAWLQVLSGFFLMFNTWGLINTFGAFETYYSTTLSPPLATQSAVSWIGSIQSFLLLFVGAIGGRLFDAGYARSMTIAGTILLSLGMLFTSLSGSSSSPQRPVFWQTFLAQGICAGLGMGLLFLPSVTIASTYFHRKRGMAIGFVTSGSSLGGIIYPLMLRKLEERIGFPWAVRALTLMIFVTLLVSCCVMRQRTDLLRPAVEGQKRPLFDYGAVKELRFMVYVAGLWFGFLGLYTPYFYIEDWAIDTKVNLHGVQSYYLISIMNACGVFGRIIPNHIADWTRRPILTQAFCVFVSGLLCLCWLAISSFGSTIAYTCLYGFFSGAFVSLPPAAIAQLTRDFSKLGARLGLMFSITSFAVLIGTPITGALQQSKEHGWEKLQGFSGAVILVGSVGLVITEFMKIGFKRT